MFSTRTTGSCWIAIAALLITTPIAADGIEPLAQRPDTPLSNQQIPQWDEDWDAIAAESATLAELIAAWDAEKAALVQLAALQQRPQLFAAWSLGMGYSSNYLRRNQAIGSAFQRSELEAILFATSARLSWQFFIYAEQVGYFASDDNPFEALALAQAQAVLHRGRRDFGGQFNLFAGDQLYDASLALSGTPREERIRQLRPEVALFWEEFLGTRHTLRLHISLRRSQYSPSSNNSWKYRAELSHKWQINRHIEFKTSAEAAHDRYDTRPARQANALLIRDSTLQLNRAAISAELSWKPGFVAGLSTHFSAGNIWEREALGFFESYDRWWLASRIRWKLNQLEAELGGSWQSQSYRDRRISLLDPRTQAQHFSSATVALRYSPTRQLTFRAEFIHEFYHTRSAADRYHHNRFHGLIQWNF